MAETASNKWIICRICLKDINGNPVSIFDCATENFSQIVAQIELHGGIKLISDDALPDKMCGKCFLLLQAANKFRNLCLRSAEQLVLKLKLETTTTSPNEMRAEAQADQRVLQDNLPYREKTFRYLKQVETSSSHSSGNTADTEEGDLIGFEVEEAISETGPEEEESLHYIEISGEQEEYLHNETTEHYDSEGGGAGGADEGVEYMDHEQIEFIRTNESSAHSYEGESLPADFEQSSIVEYSTQTTEESDTQPKITQTILKNPSLTTVSDEGCARYEVESNLNVILQTKRRKRSGKVPQATSVDGDNTDTSYICCYCGNIYNERAKLTLHLKLHSKEKPHECEICQKRFAQTPQLARHMNSHTGRRPFKCKFCTASFSDPSTCIKHQRIHTNERPYSCDTCGKSFSYSNVLKVHKMMHSGEKPFSCRVCGRKFAQRHHKKSHERIHKYEDLMKAMESEEQ